MEYPVALESQTVFSKIKKYRVITDKSNDNIDNKDEKTSFGYVFISFYGITFEKTYKRILNSDICH